MPFKEPLELLAPSRFGNDFIGQTGPQQSILGCLWFCSFLRVFVWFFLSNYKQYNIALQRADYRKKNLKNEVLHCTVLFTIQQLKQFLLQKCIGIPENGAKDF